MPEAKDYTVEEFKRFCEEGRFSCFTFHSDNQNEWEKDMDLAVTFPPPMCAPNSDTVCFANAGKNRMVLHSVRNARCRMIRDTGLWKVEIRCGNQREDRVRSYIFTVS